MSSYDDNENSAASARPKLLLDFSDEFGNHWRYNSGITTISHLTYNYTPDTCKVSEPEITSNPFRNTVKVTLSRGNAFAAPYLAAPLESQVNLIVYRFLDDEYTYYWSGMVESVNYDKNAIPTVTCNPVTSSASRIGKRRVCQKMCDLVLYGDEIGGCLVDKDSYKIEGIIDSVDGTTLESASFLDEASDWLQGGEIVIGNARRLIRSHIGTITTNDFSSDSDCKALWKFEQGHLSEDSIGENSLARNNVTSSILLYKEGRAAAQFDTEKNPYFSILDTNLDAGFPFKDGDTNKKISVCFWARLDSLPNENNNRSVFMKYTIFNCSIWIRFRNVGGNTVVQLTLSTTGGTWNYSYSHATAVAADIWYHIAVTYQASDGAYRIRIWDDNAGAILGADKTGNAVVANISDAPLYIGYNDSYYNMDGKLDEMVVFDKILTTDEIDEIRKKTFGVVAPDTGSIVISRVISDPEENSAGEIEFVAYAGCSHLVAECINKFSNGINYGGQEYLPTKNPYVGDPII